MKAKAWRRHHSWRKTAQTQRRWLSAGMAALGISEKHHRRRKYRS
jgi:hypothetical protein